MRRTAILWDRLGREDKEIKTIKISWLGTRLRKNLIKLVAVMIIALMAIPVLPAKAQPAYLPGVHVGDSVTFGDVSGNVLNFNVTSSIVETVTSVSGTTVLFTLVFNYRNGTSQTVSASSDVLNLNGQFSFLIIAGGLSAGDSIIPSTSTSSSPGAITESVQRIYAGAVRPINEFSFTNPQPGQVSSVAAYWDASTGFLLEISEIFTQSSLSQNVLHLKATSTNVWAPSTSQDFAFDAIPLTSPLVYLGQTAEFVLNLTSFQGFSGPVSLSASLTNSSLAHSPTLTLGALSVNVPTGGSATTTLGFSTNASTQLGVYLFSVHGVSGSIAHDARFAVFIVPPSFALISTPENLTIAGGSTASSTITARSLGLFSGSVSLAVYSGNPSITGILTPTNVFLSTSITSANSTLTVSAAPYAIPGDNSITVSGTSGQSQQSVTIPVSVSGPHFQLSLNTTSLTLSPGTAAAVSVNLKSISGFSGLIGLTDSSYGPAAISLNPTDIFLSSGGSASALLTVFVAPGATQGSSVYIDITGISGLLQQQASLFISIPGTSSSFFINANPFNLILKPGQNGNFTISLTSNGGFTGHIALAAQINGNPLGYVFSSTNVTLPPGGTATSTLTVSAPTSFSQGSSNINVYANSGNQSQSVFLYVNLGTPPSSGPDFGITPLRTICS